jgi:hypothetical protein
MKFKILLAIIWLTTLTSCCDTGGEAHCFTTYLSTDEVGRFVDSKYSKGTYEAPGRRKEAYFVMNGKLFLRFSYRNDIFPVAYYDVWSKEDLEKLTRQHPQLAIYFNPHNPCNSVAWLRKNSGVPASHIVSSGWAYNEQAYQNWAKRYNGVNKH